MLRAILNDNNMSLYQLEKTSKISHATLNDIYNEKSNIDNCTILTLSKIAHSLNMSVDDLYQKLSYNDLSLFSYSNEFDLFKSNTLQQLKKAGEKRFVKEIVHSRLIDAYYHNTNYLEALYLLSLVDYFYKKQHKPLLKQYDDLREYRLDKIYVSKSIFLLLATKHITATNIYKECIKEFLNHNIVEANIDDVA